MEPALPPPPRPSDNASIMTVVVFMFIFDTARTLVAVAPVLPSSGANVRTDAAHAADGWQGPAVGYRPIGPFA